MRDHFVYTAYDSEGRVLYVGCTKDLDGRMKDHRTSSNWFHLATRFHLRGPYDYKTGRQVERERLAIERPLYAFHPKRKTLAAIHQRIVKREMARLVAAGVDFYAAIAPAADLASTLTGYVDNRSPIDITDEALAAAFKAEREHVANRGAAA